MKIKIILLIIICISLTSCKKVNIVKEEPVFDIEYGVQDGLYQDPTLLIDGLSIVNKNDLFYLFYKKVEYSNLGYKELISVDYELIRNGISISKNNLTRKYIGINNGYVTIIGMDKEYKIQEQINKFVGCTLDGFIIENRDNKFDYYDYEGKLIGGKYNSVQLKDYYRNIKIQEGVYSLIYFNLNNSKDLYISGKKIENVSEYIDYPKANVLVLKINNKYKVYKYDGSITHNIVFDELSDINKDYPFLYYKDTMTMYYYKSPDQIINLGAFEGLNKINIIDIGNNYLSYLESNNVLVAFTDLGIGIYHDIEYAKSINCKYFLVEKNDKLMIVNLYKYFSYEFKGGYSEQIIEIDGHMCAVYNDTVNNNYVVIYKDAAKVYTNGNGKLGDKNKVVEYDNDTCKMVFYSEIFKSYKTMSVDKFNLDNKYYYYGVR